MRVKALLTSAAVLAGVAVLRWWGVCGTGGQRRGEVTGAPPQPRRGTLRLPDGAEVHLTACQFDPPLVVPYKDKGAPCDREDPLDVFATLTTASALEPERALLLMDEPMRQRQVAANREMGGKLLAEQPLPDRHGYIVTHWVELERDGRLYRVFRLGSRARPMGEIAPSAGSVVLVKSATGWLQTGNLAGDPVGSWAMTMPFENLVGSHSLTP